MPSCAIFRLGYLCPVLRRRYCGKFLIVSYTTMKLGKPTQFDILEKIEVVSQLKNTLCAIFRLGYLSPVPRRHFRGKFLSVSKTAMKLGKPTQFDMLQKIEVVPQLKNTLCAIFRLGYLCLVHITCCHSNFLAVSDTAMKLGKFTQYGLLKDKWSSQLRNIPCAIFVLGYSCPIHETCYHGNFRTVLAGNFYIVTKLGKPTQCDMLKMIKVIPNSEIPLVLFLD